MKKKPAKRLPGHPSARILFFDHPEPSGTAAKCLGVIRFRYSEEAPAKPASRRSEVCAVLACFCGKPFFPEWDQFLRAARGNPNNADGKVRMLHCGCRNASGVTASAFDHWSQQNPVRCWPKGLRDLFGTYLRKSGRLRDYQLAEVDAREQKEKQEGLEYISSIRAGDPLSVKQYYGLDFLQTGSVEDGIGFRVVRSKISGYVCRCLCCSRITIVSPGNYRSAKSCGCLKRRDISKTGFGKMYAAYPCAEDVVPFTGHRWMARCEDCRTEIPLNEDGLENFRRSGEPCWICQEAKHDDRIGKLIDKLLAGQQAAGKQQASHKKGTRKP